MAIDPEPPQGYPIDISKPARPCPTCHSTNHEWWRAPAEEPVPSKVPNFPPMLSAVWVRFDNRDTFQPKKVTGWWMDFMDQEPAFGVKRVGMQHVWFHLADEGKTWLREPPKVTHIEQAFQIDPDRVANSTVSSRVIAAEAMIRTVICSPAWILPASAGRGNAALRLTLHVHVVFCRQPRDSRCLPADLVSDVGRFGFQRNWG